MRKFGKWQCAALMGAAVVVAGCGVARERASRAVEAGPSSGAEGRMMSRPQRAAKPGSAPTDQFAAAVSGYGGPPASGASLEAARVANIAARSTEPVHADPLAAVAAGQLDRYLIRNATLTLEARDVRRAAAALATAVSGARGYVSETSESVDELGSRSITLQARVPYDRFDRVLREVEALGKVMEKQIGTEDVTEEFVDSQARQRNLKRAETRLLEHLNRTGRLAEVLLVEKELNRVRGEIEQLEGRLRFLTHRVAFSTLAITLGEAARPQAIVPPESFSSGKEASAAVRSLVAFAQTLWTGALWVGIWAVIWLPLGLAAWLVARRLRRPARPEAATS